MNDARIAELVAQLERVADADVRTTVQELMALVLDGHGEALARVLELVAASDGDAGAALRSVAADPGLRPVLELHGLVPPPTPAVEPADSPVTLLPTRAPERCELCGGAAGDPHPHVVDLERSGAASLSCACRACHLLLASDGAGGGRWRAVPEHRRAVDPVEIPGVPVGVAFVVVDSRRGGPVAYYPGPAGATESELDVAVADLPALVPDVEALVVRDGEAFVVPVSAAYELVGELRRAWEGITGGDAPARVLDAFFEGRPA
jgi:hypothetical protein